MDQLADPTLGLDPRTLAITHLLARYTPSFAVYDERAQRYDICIQTRVIYDVGFSRVALVLYPTMRARGECKVVVFGEDVSSDQIIVQDWAPLDLEGQDLRVGIDKGFEQHIFTDPTQAVGTIRRLLAQAYEDLRDHSEAKTSLQAIMEDDD